MRSVILTDRQKRCLSRAWNVREKKLDKKIANKHAYLKHRVGGLQARVEANSGYIRRLRGCLVDRVTDLLGVEDKDSGDLEDGEDAADGPRSAMSGDSEQESQAQTARLYTQTILVLDVLEDERVHDLLILEHNTTALKALSQARDHPTSASAVEAADKVAIKAMGEASLVRLHNSLLLIAEKAVKRSERKYTAETILSWRRQFQELDGYFKLDGRGMREREWILSEEDLSMELLAWLKDQKRVTTKATHKFINQTLFAREGGMLKRAGYGLSLPISMTTTNVWMRKLGCKHDKVKKTYYTDGHERPDVQAARKVYLRQQRKLALRKPCWKRVEWSSLKKEEKEAFDKQRETGPDAFSAETFRFESWGTKYIEFHVDFLGAGSDERHDALRKELGEDGGARSVRFDQAADAPCEHFHALEVCRCRLPLYHIGQDESVYKAYAREGTEWVIRGVRGLRKKSEGPGEMFSAFQDEKRGFGIPLSADELARVNEARRQAGRAPLDATPGLRFLLPGQNREGYWGFADFEKKTIDVMDCLEEVEPGKQLAIEVITRRGTRSFCRIGYMFRT